jgi:hypothetical protein
MGLGVLELGAAPRMGVVASDAPVGCGHAAAPRCGVDALELGGVGCTGARMLRLVGVTALRVRGRLAA